MRLEIFPTFQVHLSLDEFHSVDLIHGYYQIRFRSKATFPYQFLVHCEQSTVGGGDNRPCVVNAAGISKTVKVGFGEQSTELNDVFKCTLNIHKRIDRLESVLVELQVELWYLDPEALPRLEDYRFVSKRTLDILIKPDRSTHCHRPIFFEYFSFSAVSVTVHASMIAAVVSRKKAGPDPPISDKLRHYHRQVCFRMLSSCLSLENFIQRHSALLVSPLNMEPLNVGREEALLKNELERTAEPWLKLQSHVDGLNNKLTLLFTQLLQLFTNCRDLHEVMLEEFDQQRLKRLSEAFLFTEGTVQSLLTPTPNMNLKYFDLIKKNGFLGKLKTLPVHVDHVDADPCNVTMIVEQRFLPTSSTNSPDGSATFPPTSIPTFVTPEPPEKNSPKLNRASQKCSRRASSNFAFCLPTTCAIDGDDPAYEVMNGDFLSVNNDRLHKRRMTDPGSLLCVEIDSDSAPAAPRLSPKTSVISTGLSPGGLSIKAKSTSNISHEESEFERAVKGDPLSPSTSSESFAGPGGDAEPLNEHRTVTKERSNSFSTHADRLVEQLDKDYIAFVHQKELCKQKLYSYGFRGCFYSDLAHLAEHHPYFSAATKRMIEHRRFVDAHLIVFVHGLEGTSEDLSAYRNFLRVALPDAHLVFLMSEVNQTETWTDVTGMAENLLDELLRHILKMPRAPTKISFLAHSLGGLIVRTLCGLPGMQRFAPTLHTLLTLNSPHCGLMYNQRAANWGIALLQWWKQSVSLEQLTMRDHANYRDTFLYKLSQNGAFGMFKHVLLVGCYHDLYVPGHSALVDQCKAAMADPSSTGTVYGELVNNINESVVASPRHTTLVKYTVAHNVPRSQQVTGRAVHIAAVDDDSFIEKLLTVSAVKYFR
uniref:DUF676 domain-containing protein n=1 Tax=Panagrellus redivivus TaxID=6233 RepID=A0A7E4VNY6_PANRE